MSLLQNSQSAHAGPKQSQKKTCEPVELRTGVEDEDVVGGDDALDELQVENHRGVSRQDGGRVRRRQHRVQEPQVPQLRQPRARVSAGLRLGCAICCMKPGLQ